MRKPELQLEVTESEEHVIDLIQKYTPYLENFEKLLNRLADEHRLDATKSDEIRECLTRNWGALKCIAAIFSWKYTNGVWAREDQVQVTYRTKYESRDECLNDMKKRLPDQLEWKVYLDRWDLVRATRF